MAQTNMTATEASLVITNMTNEEPLWQSRNMWTFAVIMVSMAASAGGYYFTATDQAVAVDTLTGLAQIIPTIVTSIMALWGMWNRIFAAKMKPLGS